MKLADLKVGQKAKIISMSDVESLHRKKLLAMGLTPGVDFKLTRIAPLGCPMQIELRGYSLTVRKNECQAIDIDKI